MNEALKLRQGKILQNEILFSRFMALSSELEGPSSTAEENGVEGPFGRSRIGTWVLECSYEMECGSPQTRRTCDRSRDASRP